MNQNPQRPPLSYIVFLLGLLASAVVGCTVGWLPALFAFGGSLIGCAVLAAREEEEVVYE
jgi:hypothetical protein